jgi:hypothetical protein
VAVPSPIRVSFSLPPLRLSAPAPPFRVSAFAFPCRVSPPLLVPVKESAPEPPITVSMSDLTSSSSPDSPSFTPLPIVTVTAAERVE